MKKHSDEFIKALADCYNLKLYQIPILEYLLNKATTTDSNLIDCSRADGTSASLPKTFTDPVAIKGKQAHLIIIDDLEDRNEE